MRTIGITPTIKDQRTLSVKDFSVYCKRAVNSYPSANICNKILCHTHFLNLSVKPIKTYSTELGVVVYCMDKKLYLIDENQIVALGERTFDSPPQVFCIMKNGEKRICAVLNSNGVIMDDSLSEISLVDASDYLVIDGVVFCFKGDSVIFYNGYDYTQNTVAVDKKGLIRVDKIGDILGLFYDGKNLIVVCEKGVARLNTDGFLGDYRLEYLTVDINLKDIDGIKMVGEDLLFYNKGRLYSIKNGKMQGLETVLDKAEYTVNGTAFSISEIYLLPVSSDDENYIFVYDTITKESYFTTALTNGYADGGYYALTDDYAVGRLVYGTAESYEWQSVTTDLGSDAEKTLYKISLKTLSPLTLTVSGDHSKRTIKTDKGYKSVRLNLKSKEFSFKLNGVVKPFGIEYMKLYYRI